jgi:hypothetical protein
MQLSRVRCLMWKRKENGVITIELRRSHILIGLLYLYEVNHISLDNVFGLFLTILLSLIWEWFLEVFQVYSGIFLVYFWVKGCFNLVLVRFKVDSTFSVWFFKNHPYHKSMTVNNHVWIGLQTCKNHASIVLKASGNHAWIDLQTCKNHAWKPFGSP